jgi:hypothetical protein
MTEKKRRGPKPKQPGERVSDTRVNVSLDRTAQEALVAVQERLEGEFGFKPNLTQTVHWLIARGSPPKA